MITVDGIRLKCTIKQIWTINNFGLRYLLLFLPIFRFNFSHSWRHTYTHTELAHCTLSLSLLLRITLCVRFTLIANRSNWNVIRNTNLINTPFTNGMIAIYIYIYSSCNFDRFLLYFCSLKFMLDHIFCFICLSCRRWCGSARSHTHTRTHSLIRCSGKAIKTFPVYCDGNVTHMWIASGK